MTYNVTVLDRAGEGRTVRLAPDREPAVLETRYATNHQERVEWPAHATATGTVERERFLAERLADPALTRTGLLGAFLRPPLYGTAYGRGFGTLYTAAYDPARGTMELRWPGHPPWTQSFDGFRDGQRRVRYRHGRPAEVGRDLD
jgi:predicted choloylglycine hydrolase